MLHFIRRSWLLVGAIIALLVFLGALVLVRWALDPGLLKTVAESRLSAALGQPVGIGTVRVVFLPRLAVVGTDIVVGDATHAAGGSLEMHAIRMHPRLASIFSRPIVIDRIEIDGLALNARRDAAGRWILPLPASTGPAGANAQSAFVDVAEVLLTDGRLTITDDPSNGRTAPTTITPIQKIAASVHRAGDVTQLEALTASVGRSTVTGNGSVGPDGLRLGLRWADLAATDLPLVFALVGTNAPPGLAVEGRNPLVLDLRVDRTGEISASGKVSADRAALGTLTMTSFQSPVEFGMNRLTLGAMAFRAYSGTGSGRLTASVASSAASWGLDADLQLVDVDQLLSANTTATHKVSGIGTLNARLRGASLAPIERAVAGTVAMSIANGTIRDFPLLSAIYAGLKLGGGGDRDLHFQKLSGTFAVANARATTADLMARTGELTLTAAGTVGLDQTIAISGKAVFSAAKSDEFVRSVRELSALKNADGEIEVPLAISGTLAAPHFSIDVLGLARRGVENEIKRRLGDRLKDLFKKIK
jgi:uncharacterized protein involved in outer membrane biogenesis